LSGSKKILAVITLICLSSSVLSAKPVGSIQAQKAVKGWLKVNDKPFGTAIGRQTDKATVYTGNTHEPIYYIVNLRPSGFAIVPADDEVEPIIGFVGKGYFDPSSENPLGALVSRDLPARIAAARHAEISPPSSAKNKAIPAAQKKWARLQLYADSITQMNTSSVFDIRVSPLVESKWDQGAVCDNNCYNYYTPNNYRCGCVATAMAQLMRFYQYPATGVGTKSFVIYVNDVDQSASLRGGDGLGGPYIWSQMPLVLDCDANETQRQAVGAICYDTGVSVNTNYGLAISSASIVRARNSLTNTFGYANAVYGYDDTGLTDGLTAMINPNLDAGCPVILGVDGTGEGHAVLADGYGCNLATLYHHLNMGWSGQYDAWYNLPDIDSALQFSVVRDCIYNILMTGSGEIISGRVTMASGTPVSGAVITAQNGGKIYTALTNTSGIYALTKVTSNRTFTVSAVKYGLNFETKIAYTGYSADRNAASGNVWAIDFVDSSQMTGDFDQDGAVGFADFATIASAWMSRAGQTHWNQVCDISVPADDTIDAQDIAVFAANWLRGTETILGDFDNDGTVAFVDFATIASAWTSHWGQPNWNAVCDISTPGDDVIDMLDLAVFVSNWLYGVTEPLLGDFGLDGKVDFEDFGSLASAWMTQPGQMNWNQACDISIPADYIINMPDVAAFAHNWLDGL
jgi:hypothetical protein